MSPTGPDMAYSSLVPSVGLPGVRGTVPRAVPELLRLFAPRESMEVNPFDETIVDDDIFALDDATLEAIHSAAPRRPRATSIEIPQ